MEHKVNLGWPLTLLLILAIGGIIYLYMRADSKHKERKLEAVQHRLAEIEAKKAKHNPEQEPGPDEPPTEEDTNLK